MNKLLLTLVLGSVMCAPLNSMDSLKDQASSPTFGSRSPVNFGFVLLPDETESKEVLQLASVCTQQSSKLPTNTVSTEDYRNVTVRVPHSSLGHYGILGIDFPILKEIVTQAAKQYPPFVEPMYPTINVTKDNVTWYCQNIGKATNPKIVSLYKDLRTHFMNGCHTKTLAIGALWESHAKHDDPLEMEFFNKYYQNWGTPEPENAPRIRPHYTLVYSHDRDVEKLKAAVDGSIGTLPKTTTFKYLALVELDGYGNPRETLFSVPLTGTWGPQGPNK